MDLTDGRGRKAKGWPVMGKLGAIVAGLLATLASVGVDGPPAIPADFKIEIGSFALKKEAVLTEDIVVHEGRAYLFPSNSKEVVIIEPGRSQAEILDVGRKVQTEISFRSLEESLEKIKATLREAAEQREKQGGRGNAIEAKMTRDLFQTKLNVAFDPKAKRVRLTNPVVEVDADGEPEPDSTRLAFEAVTLAAVAKLGAFRTPTDLPPFVELETISALMIERKLRPTELAYLYRLAGPPRKFRRTYRLVEKLTEREIEAIARVDRLREAAPNLRYERYRQDR